MIKKNIFYDQKYVSVTNIISLLNKPELLFWSAKCAVEAIEDNPKCTKERAMKECLFRQYAAMRRGKRVHKAIADLSKGKKWIEV